MKEPINFSKILNPLSFDKSDELGKILLETLKNNRYKYNEQIEEFKKSNSIEENNIEFFIIQKFIRILNTNGYCRPSLTDDIPEWLKTYLFDSYLYAHNSLASQQIR